VLATRALLKRLTPLLWILPACLAPAQIAAPLKEGDKLKAVAEAARGALLTIHSTRLELGADERVTHHGFFISATGLAVAPLQAFDSGQFTAELGPNREPVQIEGVVGAHPDSGIAIVRTDQRPATWLPLAATDIAVGDPVAIIRAQEYGGPLSAPILARRKSMIARTLKYTDVLSVGANLGVLGGLHVPAGTPLLDSKGQAVGCLAAPSISPRQRFLLAFPSSALATRIPANQKKLATTPFPLPKALGPADPLALDATYLHGRIAQLSGKLIEAERLFRKALDKHPKSAMAWQRLALVLRYQARNQEALAAFEKASLHSKNLGAFELDRADQLSLNRKFDEAAAVLQAACKSTPFDFDLHRAYAVALRFKKDEAGAERHLRIATKLAPDDIDCWELLSKCLAAQAKWDDEKIASDKIFELEDLYRPR